VSDTPIVRIFNPLLPDAYLAIGQGSDLINIPVDDVAGFALALTETARRVVAARDAYNA
jgi:hypothetical protein